MHAARERSIPPIRNPYAYGLTTILDNNTVRRIESISFVSKSDKGSMFHQLHKKMVCKFAILV